MQFEALLVGVHLAASPRPLLGLASPDLAPDRSAHIDAEPGMVAALFEASPRIRGAAILELTAQEKGALVQHADAAAFDVMVLEFLASSNPPSSDVEGNDENDLEADDAADDNAADAPTLAAIHSDSSDRAVTPPPLVAAPAPAATDVTLEAPTDVIPESPSVVTKHIEEQLCTAITVPILAEQPHLRAPRRRRTADVALSPPRRSGRLAAKSRRRAANPTVQAQNVLMAKWGAQPRQARAQMESDDYDDYLALFDAPLSESKLEAIRTLFPAGCAIDGIQLVEGVEHEV